MAVLPPSVATAPLRIARAPQYPEVTSQGDTPALKSLEDIRKQTKAHHSAIKATEDAFSKTTRQLSDSTLKKLLKGSEFEKLPCWSHGEFVDSRTGLCVRLEPLTITHYGEVASFALCFPGMGTGNALGIQLKTSLQQFMGIGEVPEMYVQARALATHIQQKLSQNGQTLELVGHSMGGGIANYVGLSLNLPSVCFNAAALGRACLKELGEIGADALLKQTHVRVEDDFATHPGPLRKLMAFLSAGTAGKLTYIPRNVGVIYEIKKTDPTYPRSANWLERHWTDGMDAWYRTAADGAMH